MGRSISTLCGVILGILLSFPAMGAWARDVNLKTIQQWHDKYTVVLTEPSGKEFCSGGVVGNVIMTAAHCCVPIMFSEHPEGFGYSFDGVETKAIRKVRIDSEGNDICEITPESPEHSPIQKGEMLHSDEERDQHDPVLWVINKITYIYDDPALSFMEIQKIHRISVWDDDTQHIIVQGEGIPGTSGSLILNRKGQYVGNLVIGLFNGEGGFIEHVFGVAVLELSEFRK